LPLAYDPSGKNLKFKTELEQANNLRKMFVSSKSRDEKKDIISKMIAIASKVHPQKYQGVQRQIISKV
jgi:hypothetical protein